MGGQSPRAIMSCCHHDECRLFVRCPVWASITSIGAGNPALPAPSEVEASRWIVTVPPRMGPEKSMAFHCALHEAAAVCGVKRLVWTSSTAVYDPTQSGTLVEADAGHHTSRHTGVDMLALEDVHRNGDVPFVAMRFGGLFGQGRHPVKALLKRGTVQGGDGHVQWVHEEDAAAACVFTALHEGPLPDALNVVAPSPHPSRTALPPPATEWTSRRAESKGRCPPKH